MGPRGSAEANPAKVSTNPKAVWHWVSGYVGRRLVEMTRNGGQRMGEEELFKRGESLQWTRWDLQKNGLPQASSPGTSARVK